MGQPSSQPLRCNAGSHKGTPCPRCCMQFLWTLCCGTLSHPVLLWVGPAATRRKLVGQAYADDLAGIAATQQGLQRVVHAVQLHSLRWGWMLNVPKSIGMVFGTQSLCARLGAPDLWWGDSRLPTADTVKYLGLRPE